MTAPTLVTRLYPNSTTASATMASASQSGDLIVVGVIAPQEDNGTPSVTLLDGLVPIVSNIASTLTDTDGTKVLRLFAYKLTATPASNVTVTVNNWPTTGTPRRFVAWCLRPASGEKWANATPARTATSSGRTNTGYTSPAWGTPWSASISASSFGGAAFALLYEVGGTTVVNVDFNTGLDGTYEATDADSFGILGSGNGQLGFGGVYSANDLAATTNVGFSGARGITTNLVTAVYFVTVTTVFPKPGRANAACKFSAGFTLIRPCAARANAAAKFSGSGYKFTGTFPASGRANAAAKATGQGYISVHPRAGRANAAAKFSAGYTLIKRASGRSNSAGSGSSYQYKISHSQPARSNSAAKFAGTGHVSTHLRAARANAASKFSAGYTVKHPASGRANAAAKATGIPVQHNHTAAARGNAAAKFSAAFTVHHVRDARANAASSGTARFVKFSNHTGQGRANGASKFSAGYAVQRRAPQVDETRTIPEGGRALTTTGPTRTLTERR